MQLEGEHQARFEQALAWLRRELMEMRLQDQQLQLHTKLRELKVECADWESADPSRDGFGCRARSSSEDTGAPVPRRKSLKLLTSRRKSLP